MSGFLKAKAPGEFVMVLGFAMCTLGFVTKMFWWTFGGFLLFYLGVMALDSEVGTNADEGL